jgi:hypothetical protein
MHFLQGASRAGILIDCSFLHLTGNHENSVKQSIPIILIDCSPPEPTTRAPSACERKCWGRSGIIETPLKTNGKP